MTKFLKIPSAIESQGWDWRVRLAEGCPLISTAFRHIENNANPVSVSYEKVGAQDGHVSHFNAFDHAVKVCYTGNVPEFFILIKVCRPMNCTSKKNIAFLTTLQISKAQQKPSFPRRRARCVGIERNWKVNTMLAHCAIARDSEHKSHRYFQR
jgi:hypothetical protein